jgi:hypothetical protein
MPSIPSKNGTHKGHGKKTSPKKSSTSISVEFAKDPTTLAAIDAACLINERRRAAQVRLICRDWAEKWNAS